MDKVLLDGKICWIANNEPLTDDELIEFYASQKAQEASSYLVQTDWVNTYKIRHDLGLEVIPEDSLKWELIAKRAEAIEIIRGGN